MQDIDALKDIEKIDVPRSESDFSSIKPDVKMDVKPEKLRKASEDLKESSGSGFTPKKKRENVVEKKETPGAKTSVDVKKD